MTEPRSPYEIPFRPPQKVRRKAWYLQPPWSLTIYFVFWPLWLIIIPLFVGIGYLRKYWVDAWDDLLELWGQAYIEIPGAIFCWLKSRMKRKENDTTDHHQ